LIIIIVYVCMGNMNCAKKSKKNSLNNHPSPIHIHRYTEQQTHRPSSSKGNTYMIFKALFVFLSRIPTYLNLYIQYINEKERNLN